MCGICGLLRRNNQDTDRRDPGFKLATDVIHFKSRAYFVSRDWGNHFNEVHLGPIAYPPECPYSCLSVSGGEKAFCSACANRRVMRQMNGNHGLDLLVYKFKFLRGDDPGPWPGTEGEMTEFLEQYGVLGRALFGSGPCRKCYTFHSDIGSYTTL
jgi:hypothetical protein